MLCKWSSPLILAYVYYRDYMNVNSLYSLCNFAYLFGMVLIGVYILRGFGRLSNAEYLAFIKKFAHFNQLDSTERKVSCLFLFFFLFINSRWINADSFSKEFLKTYDFEIRKWRADFESKSLPPAL